jgi:hypothetical protein
MKKVLLRAFAAALICGTTVFTSCSTDDNPVKPTDNLAEKLIGKWMLAAINGQLVSTDGKAVYTLTSPTKAYISASIHAHPVVGSYWGKHFEADVDIKGNQMTITSKIDEDMTVVDVFDITDINETKFTANVKTTVLIDGTEKMMIERVASFDKINRDYKEAILGLWECKGLKGGETYNDANGRLDFFDDGTYQYWRKNDAGEWEAVTTREYQEYFVDGVLLCTRWKDVDGDEQREWWEIKSLKGDKMQWKALREDDDSAFQQIMDWEKIELEE